MQLQAGPLRMIYEDGFLRSIKTQNHEVLRMIYFVIRDKNWKTFRGIIQNEKITQDKNSFFVQYDCEVNDGEIQFSWQVIITGSSAGLVDFNISGKALTSFLRNRIGFCVLHPVKNLVGKPCGIEDPDGHFFHEFFPEFISPHQAFKNIRALDWSVSENATARLEFQGDTFETEDQRNWTDASFKTYCTPLELQFPKMVESGTEIRQTVSLKLAGFEALEMEKMDEQVRIVISPETIPFPVLGLGITSLFSPTDSEASFFKNSGFSHLRADIFLARENWQRDLDHALRQGGELSLMLELALFCESNATTHLEELMGILSRHIDQIKSLTVFGIPGRFTTNEVLENIIPPLQNAFPGLPVGGGSDANFTEFNRNRFDPDKVDFISFALNPQVHLSDDLTLIQNLEAQYDAVKSAQKLAPGKPIHISTVTLKPRFNAAALSPGSSAMPNFDDRQSQPFTACWTLGSLKYLSEAGARSITYFETTGRGGIVSGNEKFPIGKLLQFVLQWKPKSVQPTLSTQPSRLSTLLLTKEGKICLILANHSNREVQVELPHDFIQGQVLPVVSQREEIKSNVGGKLVLLSEEVLAIDVVCS